MTHALGTRLTRKLHMAQTLEAVGLMMIGLAKNGAGTWDMAMKVDIG